MNSKKSYWISAGKLTLVQRVAMLFFGVLNFFFLVRMMDMKSYGVWMLFISVTTLVRTTREGFFKKPLIRFINKLEGRERDRLQGTSLFLNLIFSLFTSVLLLAISGFLVRVWDAPGLVGLFSIFFVTNFVMGYFSHYNNVLEANFQFSGPMVANTLKNGVMFLFVIYFFFAKTEIDVIILGYCDLISTLVAAICMFIYSRRMLVMKALWSKKQSLQLFHYGKYTLGTNISAMILRNTDIWMLGWLISPAAVAVYNVAIRITNLFEVPTMAMASIIFPEAVKKAEVNGKRAFKDLYEKSVAVILLFIIPMVMAGLIFSDWIIWVLAGDSYDGAVGILRVTMLYGLIIPFNKQMGILLDAMGRAKLNMFFVIRNALINVVLNYIFISQMGTIGAAYATLCTLVIVMVINQIFLNKNYNVELKQLYEYSKHYMLHIKKFALSKL